MANDRIIIIGAREHNLNNIDVTIPRGKLAVLTGVSGSGKRGGVGHIFWETE